MHLPSAGPSHPEVLTEQDKAAWIKPVIAFDANGGSGFGMPWEWNHHRGHVVYSKEGDAPGYRAVMGKGCWLRGCHMVRTERVEG